MAKAPSSFRAAGSLPQEVHAAPESIAALEDVKLALEDVKLAGGKEVCVDGTGTVARTAEQRCVSDELTGGFASLTDADIIFYSSRHLLRLRDRFGRYFSE